MTIIAQITDLHVWPASDGLNNARNADRLRRVLSCLNAMAAPPAAILATGDLTDTGSAAEYAELAEILSESRVPVWLGVGNHDVRANLLTQFGPDRVRTDPNGFVQYAIDVGDLRIVMADTLDEGADDAALCEARADWLMRTLEAEPLRPTVLALHHPPIPSGVGWMDPRNDTGWLTRLETALENQPQVRALICGHMHRAFGGQFAGRPVHVCSATTIQLTLDLSPIDPTRPDGRSLLREEPPGYGLLAWLQDQLVVHSGVVGDFGGDVFFRRPLGRQV